jgi:hypothetical protein
MEIVKGGNTDEVCICPSFFFPKKKNNSDLYKCTQCMQHCIEWFPAIEDANRITHELTSPAMQTKANCRWCVERCNYSSIIELAVCIVKKKNLTMFFSINADYQIKRKSTLLNEIRICPSWSSQSGKCRIGCNYRKQRLPLSSRKSARWISSPMCPTQPLLASRACSLHRPESLPSSGSHLKCSVLDDLSGIELD